MTIGNMFDKAENAVAIIFGEEGFSIYTKLTKIKKREVSQGIAMLIKQLGLDMQDLVLDYAITSFLADHIDEEDSDNVC
nr:MAG TPA: hypothetical protein [Caudoviricetes sp.]